VAASLIGIGPAAHASRAGLVGLPAPTLEPPLAPFLSIRLFDRPAAPWAAGHRGIDLPAVEGDGIVSPGEGVVTFAGTVVDRGVVTVDHGGGLLSSVEPIAATVAVGDYVDSGDLLGVVSGDPGHCAPRTCVHWGVRFQDEYVNPLDVLAGYGRIVLLP
jgi:murein DD-endopeptidase MepM/ murein hydrolase activator NlpD